jgi:hypothetical protein
VQAPDHRRDHGAERAVLGVAAIQLLVTLLLVACGVW